MLFFSCTSWNWQNVVIRILGSVLLGVIIGLDRGVKRRGGGARTTTTVCLGATLIMLMEQYMTQVFPGMTDITRMAAQVISGVGFLGAGTILVSGHQIKGLTSAAGIWFSACVGLVVGIGFLDIAVLATLVLITVLHMIPKLERLIYSHTRYMTLYLEVEDGKMITEIFHKLKEDGCIIDTFDVAKPKTKGHYSTILAVIYCPPSIHKEEYLSQFQEMKGVVSADDM